MRKISQKSSGFTLIELMIGIAIISILSGIAIPAVMNWLPNYRLKAAARDLYSNMQKAKLEAVKRNTDVIITFTTGVYVPAGRIGSYQIFVDDSPNNGAFDAGERVIAQVSMQKNVSLYLSNFSATVSTGYNSRGLPWNNRWGRAELQNNNSRFYQITLSSAGSTRMRTGNDGMTWN